MKLIKLESSGSGKPHLKTTAKTDADFSKISSILSKSNITHATSIKTGLLIFRDRFDMMKAEKLLGKRWVVGSVNENAYTDQTDIKASLLNNNEFTNLLSPKASNWIRSPNIKIFNWKGSSYVVTDGKMEIIINKNKPMSIIKPYGRVRGEVKKLFNESNMKLKNILVEERGPCWKGYKQVGMKDKGGKEVPNCVPESVVKEAKPTTSSAPGQWVAFLSMTRGKKLLKTFDTARGAKMFLSKNVDKLLGGANVESVGIMTKTQWDTREAKYAIEGIEESSNKPFMAKSGKDIFVDTTFVQLSNKFGKLDHMGMGDFVVKTDKGNVEFHRKSNKIDGFSGRAHMLVGDTTAISALIKNMKASVVKEGINEATNKTFKIPTQRGILHIEVEEDPAGIFVDVIFNKVEVTMTDIQFPTGEVKITQKQKRVKLKEGINECGCGGTKLAPMVRAVNEAEYKFGSVEYTVKNMTPTNILDLAYSYHQSSLNKIAGKDTDGKIRVARDLGRLLGKNPMNPNERGKESALLLFTYKQKLLNTEEYKELYNGLFDKLKKISNALSRGPRGGSDFTAGSAKAAAKADMQKYL